MCVCVCVCVCEYENAVPEQKPLNLLTASQPHRQATQIFPTQLASCFLWILPVSCWSKTLQSWVVLKADHISDDSFHSTEQKKSFQICLLFALQISAGWITFMSLSRGSKHFSNCLLNNRLLQFTFESEIVLLFSQSPLTTATFSRQPKARQTRSAVKYPWCWA